MAQLKGRVLAVSPTEYIDTKNGKYPKRELTLDCTRYNPETGDKYTNTPLLECGGEKLCEALEGLAPGTRVTVSYEIQGQPYTAKDGSQRIFTRVRPYKVEADERQPAQGYQQPSAQPQRQQVYYPQQGQPFPPAVQDDGVPF